MVVKKIAGIFIIASAIALLLGCKNSCRKSKEWFVNNEYGQVYNSKIELKYRDSNARYVPKFRLKSGQVISIWNMDVYNMAIEEDLLLKKAKTMRYFLVKKNDTIMFYQKVCDEDVTDDFVNSIK